MLLQLTRTSSLVHIIIPPFAYITLVNYRAVRDSLKENLLKQREKKQLPIQAGAEAKIPEVAKSFQSLLENLDDFDRQIAKTNKNPKLAKRFKEEHKSSLSYVQNLDLSEILPLMDGESD